MKYTQFFTRVLTVFVAVMLFTFLCGSFFQVGDRYYSENKNYNGYFAVVDEEMLLLNGFTYYETEFSVPAQPLKVYNSYRRTVTYDNYTLYPSRFMLSQFYPMYCPVFNSSGTLVSGTVINGIMVGRTGTSVWNGSSFTVMDATTNYRIEIVICGISNYPEVE